MDTWLEVEGNRAPLPGHTIGEISNVSPILEASALRNVEQPEQPYE